MISLDGGYAIDTYDKGYIVGKVSVALDAKTGQDRETIRMPAYFQELSDAIEWAYKALARDKIGSHRKNIGLEQAIRDMRIIERQLTETLEPIRKLEARWAREAAHDE